MTRRGRPRSREGSVRMIQVKLRLYLGADDDLLGFFVGIPPRLRTAMVKQALRSGVSSTEQGATSGEEELFEAPSALVSISR